MGLFKWVGNLFTSKDDDLLVGWIVDDLRDPYKSAPWNKTQNRDDDTGSSIIDDESDYVFSDVESSDNWFDSDSDDSVSDSDSIFEDDLCPGINPANGLPMVGCSVDIEGNLYGTDFSHDDMFSSMTDDTFGSSSFTDDTFSSFDDSFGSSGFSDDW